MLRLTMRRGPTPGTVYELGSDEITIGRGNKNSIVIHDNEVSRNHCRLVRLSGNYQVHDLNSSNGTFVNGQRIRAGWLLEPGALIELGDSITLEYSLIPNGKQPQQQPSSSGQNGKTAPLPPPIEAVTHYSLLMVDGPNCGAVFPLEGETVTLGRDPTCDIIINDFEISRYHLRLTVTLGGYVLEDLGSTNGTFVNDQALHETIVLHPDDSIRLGTKVQLRYLQYKDSADGGEEETPIALLPVLNADEGITDGVRAEARRSVSPRSTGTEPGALRDHIMIVYAREDWESLIAPLLIRMQDTHVNAWVDQYLTPGGENWRLATEQALNECWLMLLVVSPAALNDASIRLVYRYFLSTGKPILLLIRDATLPLPEELVRQRSILYDTNGGGRSFHKLVFEIMQHHKLTS